MHLPVRSRFVAPAREIGASALDRRSTVWAAPDPAAVYSDPLAPLTAPALRPTKAAPVWAAPDAALRVNMAPPAALALAPPAPNAVPISTVEPLHTLALPDLVALARVHAPAAPVRSAGRPSIPSKPLVAPAAGGFAPPTAADLVLLDTDQSAHTATGGAARRPVSGKFVAMLTAGVCAAAAAAVALATLI